MALDFKKVALVAGVLITVITVVYSVLAVPRKQQTNDVVGPGRFSEPSLKFVSILFRHGNRAPIFKCNTDPHKNTFSEGKMELTKVLLFWMMKTYIIKQNNQKTLLPWRFAKCWVKMIVPLKRK